MARQLVDRREPRPQRQLAPMHHRTSGHRRLPVAAGTLPGERLGLELPAPTNAAGRTDEPIRPPLRGEVAGARRPVRKPSVELRPRHRPIGFPSARHKNIMATFGRPSTASNTPSYYHWGRRSQREEPFPSDLGANRPFGGVLSYTFIGSYIWTIQYLIRRMSNFDLAPISFFQ